MTLVGVISDTHIGDPRQRVPAEVLAAFAGVACILHGGDILLQGVLDSLRAIAPVHAVYGNCDPADLARRLSDRLVVTVDGVRIGLTHGHLGEGASTPQRARAYCLPLGTLEVVVFGHSHQPYNREHAGILLFNPGSPTQRRREPKPSYGLLDIVNGACHGRIVLLG